MSTTVYASRLARLPVLDPEGGEIGRVQDVVIGPPGQQLGPPVLGFVVSVPGRRVFVNAARVLELEAQGMRLRTGSINLRRFAARPAELLLLRDIIGRRIGSEVINDVALETADRGAHTWHVTTVNLLPDAGGGPLRLRRRSGRRSVSWTEAREVFGRGDDRYSDLRDLHPADVAARVLSLSPVQRQAAATSLDDEQLADLLEELPEDVQLAVVAGLDTDRAADVLEFMAPDDAADLLGELEQPERAELLAAMEPEEAEPLRRLLRYGENTAGGLMTPEPVMLGPDESVAMALARMREPDLPPATAAQVFVCEPPVETPTGRFLGTAHFQRLLREAPSTPLRECLDPEPEPIPPSLVDAEVARRMAAYNLVALPVCDHLGRLLGAVTIDDVVDHLLPQDWREG
jgi:CBS domain-containing protein